MKALIFIQKNDGSIFYKADSFWSATSKIDNAKIYRDDDQKEIDNWIIPYGYNLELLLNKRPEELDRVIKEYHQCKLGYRTINDEFLENKFLAKSETKDEDLGPLIYTHEIQIDGLEKPKVIDIRKRYIRDEKIKQILK